MPNKVHGASLFCDVEIVKAWRVAGLTDHFKATSSFQQHMTCPFL
jgi:hypothetical protein